MQNKKKILGSMIWICIFVMLMSWSVLAEETKGQCGKNATWEYDAQTHILYLNGTGGLYRYTDYRNAVVPWETYNHDIKEVRIAKGITKIDKNNFNFDELDDDDITVKVYGDTSKYRAGALNFAKNVIVYGKADNIAAVTYSYYREDITVKKAKSNHEIIKKKGMFLSKNQKQILYYYGSHKTVKIPDSVRVINKYAFSRAEIDKVILGKNVKRVEAWAFAKSTVKELSFNKKLKYIGEGGFFDTYLTQIELPKKLKLVGDWCFKYAGVEKATILGKTKIGAEAFPLKTKLIYQKGIKNAYTSVAEAYYWVAEAEKDDDPNHHFVDAYWGLMYRDKPGIRIKCAKVEDASGYEVSLTQKGKEVRRHQKSREFYVKNTDFHFLVNYSQEDNPKAIYVRVRPYKKVNGKKVYGKWGTKRLVEDWSGEECF